MSLRSAVFLVVLAAAAAVRFAGLGAKSLWLDEVLTWRLLQFPVPEMIQRTGGTGTVHPPLYFLCLRGWAAVWGDSEVALRSLSAVFGVATVVGVYFLVSGLGRLRDAGPAGWQAGLGGAALLAAALVALNPMQIHLAQQARSYTLGTALVAWSGWVLVRALGSRTRPGVWWALYAGLALALCYTHHVGLFTVAAQGLFAIVYLARPTTETFWQGRQRRRALLTASAIAVGYSVWVPNLLGQAGVVSEGSWQPRFTLDRVANETFTTVFSTFAHRTGIDPAEAWAVTALLGAVLAALLATGWEGRFIAALGLGPALVLVLYSVILTPNLYYSRYLSFAEVGWLAGLALAWAWMPSAAARAGWAALLLGASAYFCHESWQVIGPVAQPGMRAAVARIQESRAPGEPLVTGDRVMFLRAAYYARHSGGLQLLVSPADVPKVLRSAHLRQDDLLTPGDLEARKPKGVWFIQGSPARGKQLPAGYAEPASTESFPADYRWESAVVIGYYPRAGQ